MAEIRFWFRYLLSIAAAVLFLNTLTAQTGVVPAGRLSQSCDAVVPSKDVLCKVYALSEFADDANLCKWIAETIPQMIQPGMWKDSEGKMKLSYYAPGKVLVITQTAAVHAQVDEFLQGVRKSLPQAKAARHDSQVVPAQFVFPAAQAAPTYVAPMASQAAPKHLLHFIFGVGVRYEGEGIIDSNVVKFAKAMAGEGASADRQCVPPMVRMDSAPGTILPSVDSEAGVTLPQANYLKHPPQYVRPMPPADAPVPVGQPTTGVPMSSVPGPAAIPPTLPRTAPPLAVPSNQPPSTPSVPPPPPPFPRQ